MESEQHINPIKLDRIEYHREILKNSGHNIELFNRLEKLNKGHNIKASGTMIKVTYKKESRGPNMSNCNSSTYSDFYNESPSKKKNSSVYSYNGSRYSVNEEANCSVSSTNGSTFDLEASREFSTNQIVNVEPEDIQNTQVNSTSSLILNPVDEGEIPVQEEIASCSEPATKTTVRRKRKMQHVVLDRKSEPEIFIGSSSDEEDEEDEEELLLDDPNLPPGWQRIIHTRKGGASDGQNDVHILSPDGKRFRFRAKLKKYLEKTNSPYNIDRFYFGLYKKKEPGASVKVPKKKGDVEVFKGKKKKPEGKVSTPPKNTIDAFHLERSSDDGEEIKEISSRNLPSGWKKCVILRNNHKNQEKRRICYVSPDGKKFKQKKRLSDFLASSSEPCNIDLFDFEDDTTEKRPKRKYVKRKDKLDGGNQSAGTSPEIEKKRKESVPGTSPESGAKKQLKYSPKKEEKKVKESPASTSEIKKLTVPSTKAESSETVKGSEKRKSSVTTSTNYYSPGANITPNQDMKKSRYQYSCPPMVHDPHLPNGWKRAIKIRSYGDSAGRMEVIIVSPDGRKHRNRGALEQYLSDKKLPFKSADFDFSLFGSNKKSPVKRHSKQISPTKAKVKVIETDGSSKENNSPVVVTPESAMINHVRGIMLTCGITSMRNERRLRMSKEEHEKVLKDYLESNKSTANSEDSSDVPIKWIQDLAKCRSEFGSLSDEAASAIASATKEFIQEFALRAFQSSESPETGLEYKDVADFVEKSECLSPLKVLIPKKITFKEFVKLSRPKKYVVSFTA